MMNKEPVFLLAFVTTIIRQLVKAKKIARKHQRDSDDWGINKWLVRLGGYGCWSSGECHQGQRPGLAEA